MVMAIAICGLIFASAIIPTTQVIATYQATQTAAQAATAQTMAAVRPEQVGSSIWRDADPPTGHDALASALETQLQVGNWTLRQADTSFEQQWQAAGWTPLADPVETFAFGYLLTDGSWTASVSAGDLDDVIALKFAWNDADSGSAFFGMAVLPDRAFSAGQLELALPDTSDPYDRSDYEQTITLSLGSWK